MERKQVSAVTEFECVMSLWWGADAEAGFGQGAVDEVAAVLDLSQAAAYGAGQVVGAGERGVGCRSAAWQRPDSFDRVQVWGVGGRVVDGRRSCSEANRRVPAVLWVVRLSQVSTIGPPGRVCDLEQVAIVAPGGILAPVRAAVAARAVDQPGAFAGFVAGQGGDRESSPGTAAYPEERGASASGPGAGGGRRHRESGFVVEGDPGPECRRRSSTCGQVSFTHTATAASSRSSARRAGTCRDRPWRISRLRTPCSV